jgi:hypothetical protein
LAISVRIRMDFIFQGAEAVSYRYIVL